MSTSSRPSARAPITDSAPTAGWAGASRQVIAARTRGRGRRVAWLTGAAAATSLVAACGSASSSQPAAVPTVTVTSPAAVPSSAPAPSTQPPATVPSKPAPSGGAGGGAGLAACRTGTLHIAVDASQAQGAAGSAYYPLNFTNTSGTACEMYGYPGVSFAAAPAGAGRQIGVAAQRSSAFAKVAVRLAAGQTAHAWLKVAVAGNYPAATCQPVTAHWLRIYPPGETAASYVGHPFDACSSASAALLSVLPVRAGQGVAGVTP
jgi:hypothetical protein